MNPLTRTFALLLFTAAACTTGDAVAARPYNTTFETVGDTTFARTTGDVPESMVRRLAVEWRAGADSIDSLSVGDVSGIAVAPDGRVWAWDHVTPALWTLDANGAAMRRVGRRGNGPREYVTVNGIAVDKDGRVVMWDEGNTRLNFYKADGTFETSTTLPFSECCPGSAVTLDSQNRIWLAGHIMPGATKGPEGLKGAMMKAMIEGEREVVAFFVFDSTGALVDKPDGRYVGRVVAPRQFSPYAMRGENVWGVLRDDDDVPSVVRMRIDPPTT